MTENERKVLRVLRGALHKATRGDLTGTRWLSPTRIGLFYYPRRTRKQACSWACRHLRGLRGRGLVRREPLGVYMITKAGLAALETG